MERKKNQVLVLHHQCRKMGKNFTVIVANPQTDRKAYYFHETRKEK